MSLSGSLSHYCSHLHPDWPLADHQLYLSSTCSALRLCLFLQGGQSSPSYRKSTLNSHWKDWCWSSSTLATWCEEPTHWKRPRCWERLRAGERDDRGWDGWMASPTQLKWVFANSGRWWRTVKPGMLQSTGSQRVRHDLATEYQGLFLLLPDINSWPFSGSLPMHCSWPEDNSLPVQAGDTLDLQTPSQPKLRG